MTNSNLTPARFDRLTRGPEMIWGLGAIAGTLNMSVDKVRRLSKMPDVPIYQPPGAGYFARRSDLHAWLTTKEAA